MARVTWSLVVCLVLTASLAEARSIAVNFMADSWGGGPYPLAPTELAGVFPQQSWNNAAVINDSTDVGGTSDILSPQPGLFVNDLGAATSLTMTWHADKDAGSDGGSGSPDERLMKGFLEGYGRSPSTGYAVRVEVANVPYSQYKVVPYLIGFSFDATASVRIGGERYYYVQSSDFTTDGYRQATATSLATAQLATYAVFDNQTADHFTLDIFTEVGNRGALAGLQIISTSPGPPTGDYNVDGSVNAADYVVWRNNVGYAVPQCTGGDANCNGFVEWADYGPWRTNYGYPLASGSLQSVSGYAGSPISVPEPSALLLCALAIVLSASAKRTIAKP